MPHQNWVTPNGDIVVGPGGHPGTFFGNRGPLVRDGVVRHHQNRRWIICELDYKGWRAPSWGEENTYTPLFFLDEAVALAAGHRPCALCRRPSYHAYRDAVGFTGSADDLDRQLHAERWDGRGKRLHEMPWREVPVGAYVMTDEGPARVDAPKVSDGAAIVLTPPTSVAALRRGYPVRLQPPVRAMTSRATSPHLASEEGSSACWAAVK